MKCLHSIYILSVALILAGCGESGGLPEGETGTVSGSVKFKGQPVAEGSSVVFIQAGGQGIVGNGTTDASGKYTLSMRDGTDILVGTYQVGVSPPSPTSGMTPDEIMNLEKPPEAPKVEYQEKYLSPEMSGLKFEVTAGDNTIDIELD